MQKRYFVLKMFPEDGEIDCTNAVIKDFAHYMSEVSIMEYLPEKGESIKTGKFMVKTPMESEGFIVEITKISDRYFVGTEAAVKAANRIKDDGWKITPIKEKCIYEE